MNIYRDTWEKHVCLLTDAVDEITKIGDFLAISENHILEDINLCIQAMFERNSDSIYNNSTFNKRYNRIYFPFSFSC